MPRPGVRGDRADDLRALLRTTADTRRRLEQTLHWSRHVLAEADRIGRAAQATRLASRAHLRYATVVGEVDGRVVHGVVRHDGSLDGDRSLMERAELVAALGDAFDGGRLRGVVAGTPVAVTLTLLRACDRVHHVDMGAGAARPARPR